MFFHWNVRDPFFDALTHEDDDDEEEDGFDFDGIHRDQQHPFGGIWRFGFSFGPDGTEFKEPKSFDQILEELDKRSGHSGTSCPWNTYRKFVYYVGSKNIVFF